MPLPSHFRAAAERVYQALFEEEFYWSIDPSKQPVADQLTRVFKESMIARIEAAIRGEQDPLVKVVREARMTKPEKKEPYHK